MNFLKHQSVSVVSLSMEGQKALRSSFVFRRWTKVLQVWNDM